VSSSVTRAMRILDLIAQSEKPLTLARIAEALDIPKSTAHGILRDLARESFVEVVEPAAYAVGLKAFEVGAAHLRRTSVIGFVAPELGRLTGTLGMTSHYAVLDGADVVYLCKEDPPGLGIQLASSIGARLPSHLTAVGKACLAALDADRISSNVALGRGGQHRPRTLTALKAELTAVRERGYAFDDGETAMGIRCVAAPVFGLNGCTGAVGVSYLRESPVPLERVAEQVVQAAGRASAQLGGRATA
jgi:DNA-binding IclR family transcriptional regulator